jgi:hypothetical protein
VIAKVIATRNMNLRSLTGHAGYHLPKAVLGQRQFANPSNGSYFPYSARQDYRDAPYNFEGTGYEGSGLTGGVLRTAEGQAYGKARLVDRIRQLNAISAAKAGFVGAVPMGVGAVPSALPAPTTTTPEVGAMRPTALTESGKTELFLLLSQIVDNLLFVPPKTEQREASLDIASIIPQESVVSGMPHRPNQKSYGNITTAFTESVRAFQLIIRVVSTAEGGEGAKDLNQILDYTDSILQSLLSYTDADYNLEEDNPPAYRRATSLLDFWQKMREYISKMLSPPIFNLQPRDKQTASKTLVKSLNFGEFLRDAGRDAVVLGQPAGEIARLTGAVELPPGRRRLPLMFGTPSTRTQRSEDDDDDDEDGGGGGVANAYRNAYDGGGEVFWRGAPPSANTSRFTGESVRSDQYPEDFALARGRGPHFDFSQREAFGYASGDWFPTGGRPMGFFGEAPETYGEAPEIGLAREDAYSRNLASQMSREAISRAQARARGEEGTNVALRPPPSVVSGEGLHSFKNEQTGEYDIETGVRKGKGNGKEVKFAPKSGGMTRQSLPTTLDGFKALADSMVKSGGARIRINKNSTLKNVRRNFIKRLGL